MSCICHFFKVLARRAGLLTAVAAAAFFLGAPSSEASARTAAPAYPAAEVGGESQYSHFPIPLNQYNPVPPDASLYQVLSERNKHSGGFNLAVTLVFFGAIIHTFLAGRFERYSHKLALRYKGKPPFSIFWEKWKPCSESGLSLSCSCAGSIIPLRIFPPI